MGWWWPAFSDIWILSPLKKKKKKKKTLSELQSWTPLDKTFWIRAWVLIWSSAIDWLTQTLCLEILRNQAKTKDLYASTMQSLPPSLFFALSLSTFTTCYQSLWTCSIENWKTVDGHSFISTCDNDSEEVTSGHRQKSATTPFDGTH